MSYSRWIDSDWYVYWVAPSTSEAARDPVLSINWANGFSVDLRHSVLVAVVGPRELAPHLPEPVEQRDLEELCGYVREFCLDVAEDRAANAEAMQALVNVALGALFAHLAEIAEDLHLETGYTHEAARGVVLACSEPVS